MSNTFQNSIINKITQLQVIIQNIIRANQLYKTLGQIETTELVSCVNFAENIYLKLKNIDITITIVDENQIINILQAIIGDLSALISLYGCDTLDNLINICIGTNYKFEEKYINKYKILNQYFRPTRYKIVDWRKTSNNSKEEVIAKTSDNLDCFDLNVITNFQLRISGIKVAIHNLEKQNTIIVYGSIEDAFINLIDNEIVINTMYELNSNKPEHPHFNIKTYERFLKCITLKDVLIHTTDIIKNKYITFIEEYVTNIKKPLAQTINDFIEQELFEKRNTLINLLVNSDNNESHYLAYLLYDLLSNDIHGIIDTYEQTTIYDSLPWSVKKYFQDAMKQTVNYANKLSKIDLTKLTLEQRICLMKTDDIVKEKAMIKLKEVKTKSEDTGSKAMQYLDGLLKIPFGIYKEEPILRVMNENITLFSCFINKQISLLGTAVTAVTAVTASAATDTLALALIPVKPTYTSLEIQKYIPLLKEKYKPLIQSNILAQYKKTIGGASLSKAKIIGAYDHLKSALDIEPVVQCPKLISVGKTPKQLRDSFLTILDFLVQSKNTAETVYERLELLQTLQQPVLAPLNETLTLISKKYTKINTFMLDMKETLDKSVHGHLKAKRQIERIIGQWINGDITGYCFGFEGPPGVGKTSLAKKGISCCLKDDSGVARPFAFIAMGGSTNSSTLDGHNYTYVGSSWGRIADILMDTKIMNPIIFIDELDKVSKTENGKEIIGILTHLVDQTQNDSFQDKYFNGINLNLSKALFIFSYNDAEAIDRILLDRIHRIKFDNLSIEDKLVISRNYILPEIYKKMGLCDMIEISDEVIAYIIEEYTAEPGVRKLKEIMFEIFGEINLATLNTDKENDIIDIPIIITIADIKNKYLKERREIRQMKIHATSSVGVINGLWANALGKGGVLPIEASFYPCNTFLELKLTGMQGDVMKESMTVAKSLAWLLFVTSQAEEAQTLQLTIEKNKTQGIHIHVPEGATPKDGPSAGTAITIVLYSLFSGRKIKHDIAITGEISLQGRVTAIGGLDLKILGGIRAGVKTFIYPQENQKDFNDFMEKYTNKSIIKGINFIPVETIAEVIPLVFVC